MVNTQLQNGTPYSPEKIADELDIKVTKVKSILEMLYLEGEVVKVPGSEEERTFYLSNN